MKSLIIVLLVVVSVLFAIEPVFAPSHQAVPDRVENLEAIAVGKSQINLSWDEPNDNDSPITGYQIERRVHGPWQIIVSDTENTKTAYSDTGLEQDTTYSYRVSAINSEGIGNASTPHSATTFGLPTKPRALEADPGNQQVILSWKEPVSDGGSSIIDYEIKYSNDNGESWAVFEDRVSSHTKTLVDGLSNNVKYKFRVSAINEVGKGPYSETSATPYKQGSSYDRSPPEILGIGFFKINTENVESPYSKVFLGLEMDDSGGFIEFIPYSKKSDKIDLRNFGSFTNYEKNGQYLELDEPSLMPTFRAEVGKPIQIQLRLKDQFASTKIEHVGFYLKTTDDKLEESNIQLIWNKGKKLEVIDRQDFLSNVRWNTSLEDGIHWAIIDLIFEKEITKTDITIETWNEERRPERKTIEDFIKIVNTLDISEKNTVSMRVDVEVTHDTSSPVCKVSGTCFIPNNAKIMEGGIVSWINTDSFLHDIESGTPGNHDGRFDIHVMPGETGQKKFMHGGVYKYFCDIHPWSTGTVTVVSKDFKSEEPVIDETKPVLLVSSETSSGSIMIENKDTVVIPNKDLSVEITGHIQEKKGKQTIHIKITKPDGTVEKISTHTNEKGYYFIPTVLDDRWQEGTYKVSAIFNKGTLGEIEFSIDDTAKGFGGKLMPVSKSLENKIQSIFEKNQSFNELEEWLVEKNFKSEAIKYIHDRILLFRGTS